jgi:glycosyltransferase involved in cell wall biosynthesis
VTTPLGVAGLKAKHEKHAYVADSAKGLAEGVITVLSNKEQADNLCKNARALIEENYTWEKITDVLEGVYRYAIKES